MRAEISPPTYLHPSASLRSKQWKEQHKRHRVYTGSGYRCGVIPYSSVVVWWIASWADDEQYKEEQPREGLLLVGAMNCWEELSHPSLCLYLIFFILRSPISPFALWVAGPIYRGPGPLPKYRAGREPTMAG